MLHDAVETYHRELQAIAYVRLGEAELAEVRARYAAAHHSNAIEGIGPTAEQQAFYAMVLDLRLPQDLADRYSRRLLQERI